jgi:hypothetical protein
MARLIEPYNTAPLGEPIAYAARPRREFRLVRWPTFNSAAPSGCTSSGPCSRRWPASPARPPRPTDRLECRLTDPNPTALAADFLLALLAEGDYLVELVAGAGGKTERRLVAFRVVR